MGGALAQLCHEIDIGVCGALWILPVVVTLHSWLCCSQQEGAQLLLDKLSLVEGLSPVRPQGAMYIMVGIEVSKFRDIEDDLDFVKKLLAEKSVFVVPGQVRSLVTHPPKLHINTHRHTDTHTHTHHTHTPFKFSTRIFTSI